MSRTRVAGIACSMTIVLLVGSCSGGERRVSPSPSLDQSLLRRLGLTRHVPDQVRLACEQARQFARVPVICPRLVPDVPITKMRGSWGAVDFWNEPRGYELNFDKDFFHPSRNCGEPAAQGNCPGVRHWIVGGGNARVVRKWVLTDHANEVPGDPKLVRTVRIRGHTVLVYRFPKFPAGGMNGSHWAAFCTVGNYTVFASLHGRTYVEAAIQMALELADQAEQSGASRLRGHSGL
jgi:hypothetical protein